MPGQRTIVIVGGGLAGARAAETLRSEGFDGRVVILGDEVDRPYERPPLSKGYLAGDADRASVFVHEDEHWYAEHDVELHLGAGAESIDREARTVRIRDDGRLRYDKLLLATGSTARRLRIPGAELDGVLTLRRLRDSDRIRAAIRPGARIVVVGAGWIGLETAAVARSQGADVTVVEPLDVPLARALGPEMGAVFARLHRDHGVELLLGTGVESFRAANGNGSVGSVVTSTGRELEADAVVVGIGAAPNLDLARDAGLAVGDGVLVDASLRTDDPDVYAAGDIANVFHPLFGARVRVEHWANALNAGPAAARAMLGQDVVYDRVPYFFTDQYDLGMEYTGWAPEGTYDQVVVRGDLAGRAFIAFYLSAGRVLAGMNVNVWDVAGPIGDLVRSRVVVDPAALADPGVPLTDFVPPAAT